MTAEQFEEKVKSMTGKEIVLAMIEGLENPVMEVDMSTYGEIKNDICYGCAATNAVCKIGRFEPAYYINEKGMEFWGTFEYAINSLRLGDIIYYNAYAQMGGFAKLPKPKHPLPILVTENYKENLIYYKEYAETLE